MALLAPLAGQWPQGEEAGYPLQAQLMPKAQVLEMGSPEAWSALGASPWVSASRLISSSSFLQQGDI